MMVSRVSCVLAFVAAIVLGGCGGESSGELPAPGAFSLLSPVDASTGVSTTPVLDWEDSTDAATYRLRVSDSPAFETPTLVVDDATLTSSTYALSIPLDSGVTYYWMVSADNATGVTDAGNNGIAFTTNAPQKLTATDGAAGDEFGSSVSVSGNTAVVGARCDDSFKGAALVFVGSDGSWAQEQKLTADDGVASDLFGCSVAVSGDTAVVGAVYDDSQTGSAYVFVRDSGVWTQQQKLTASDGVSGDYFGCSVAISGETIVVGALFDDDSGADSGSAYVFVRSSGTWSQQGKLLATDGAADDNFGSSVSVSADTAVVGAYGDDTQTGSAYAFLRSGTTWSQQSKLVASDKATGDYFGYSVAVSGDTAVVGAYLEGAPSGSAYAYVRSEGSWSQQAKLTASDGATDDNFGHSVSVDGDVAVVGAYGDDDGGAQSGSAYWFGRTGTAWTEHKKIVAADGAAGDRFGCSVSVSGGTAVIGADQDDDKGDASGSAYVFE